MKKTILCIALAFSSYTYAQVGINTKTPKATLDISANPDGTIGVPSGLLIPRITRIQAAKVTTSIPLITTPVESTLIYINDISGETPTSGVAMDIDTKGYYFYSAVNQKWTKIANNPDGTSNFNFYFDNGLTSTSTESNTNVQLGGTITKETILNIDPINNSDASLKITGNINNVFSVDDALSVDGENSFVGIGTKNPQNKLHISSGSLQLEGGPLRVGSDGGTGSPGILGQVLVSKGSDAPPEWTTIDLSGGGSLNPIAINTINGIDSNDDDGDGIYTIKLGGNPIVEKTTLNIDPINNSDASLNITGNVKGAFSVGGSNFSVDNTGTGGVGIGTSSPSRRLHIYNSRAGAIRIVDGTEGDNKVLTSDNQGVGTWQPLPTATPLNAENGLTLDKDSNTITLGGRLNKDGDTVIITAPSSKLNIAGDEINAFSVRSSTATNLSVDNNNNRVGIGTITPEAPLTVTNGISYINQSAPKSALVQFKTLPFTDTLDAVRSDGHRRFVPVYIDENGQLAQQKTILYTDTGNDTTGNRNSYSVNEVFTLKNNTDTVLFNDINEGSIVTFDFWTNYAFGNSNSSIIYGKVSFSILTGFKIVDWQVSGNSLSQIPEVTASGEELSFVFRSYASLYFNYANGELKIKPVGVASAVKDILVTINNGLKIR